MFSAKPAEQRGRVRPSWATAVKAGPRLRQRLRLPGQGPVRNLSGGFPGRRCPLHRHRGLGPLARHRHPRCGRPAAERPWPAGQVRAPARRRPRPGPRGAPARTKPCDRVSSSRGGGRPSVRRPRLLKAPKLDPHVNVVSINIGTRHRSHVNVVAFAAWNVMPCTHARPGIQGAHRRCGRNARAGLWRSPASSWASSWFWPLALAYLVWKMMGYPKSDEAKAFLRMNLRPRSRTTSSASRGAPFGGGFVQHRQRRLRRLSPQRTRASRGRAPQARRGGPRLPRLRRGAEAGQGPRGVRRLHGQAPRATRDGPTTERLISLSRTTRRSAFEALRFVSQCDQVAGAGYPPRASGRRAPDATGRSGAGSRPVDAVLLAPRSSRRRSRQIRPAGTSGRSRSPCRRAAARRPSPKTRPSNSSSCPSGQAMTRAETKWARRCPSPSAPRFSSSRSTRAMAAGNPCSARPNRP